MAAGDITRADGTVRKAGSSPFRNGGSSSSKKKDTSTSPMAKKGTSSNKKDDPRKIKTTAERQARDQCPHHYQPRKGDHRD